MSEENKIGAKIRQYREDRGISVEELAEASQSDVQLIEDLENGALVPSLTPLLRIARALGVRLGTFMDDSPHNGPFLVKSGKSEKVIKFSGKISNNESALEFYSLAYGKEDRHMEPFLIDLHPLDSDEYELSSHEGEEFIYVLKGKVEILYGQDSYIIEEGDSIYYDSIIPHDLHAHEDDSKILAVVYAP
jgi:transcriptional regulator with XRE-family HTH domain